MPYDEQNAKDYAELMNNIKDYCNDNINSKTKSILSLIEKMMIDFETDKDLSIYVNDVKISQFVMNEIYTTDWTNQEKFDFLAKTRSVIPSFKQEDEEEEDEDEDEEYIYADGYDYLELMEKIVAYCHFNNNVKTQNMMTLIQTTLIEANWNNPDNLTKERIMFKIYWPVFCLVIDKMVLDEWTDNEKAHMFINTIETIPGFCNGKEQSICNICDGVNIMSI